MNHHHVNCNENNIIYIDPSSSGMCLRRADQPQVTLSLGSTLNPDDIKEGDDVYFECHIKANPKEHRIAWSHDVSKHHDDGRCQLRLFFVFRARMFLCTTRVVGRHHVSRHHAATSLMTNGSMCLCLSTFFFSHPRF